jgi:hypothetical protein
MNTWLNSALLGSIVVMLLEARITIGTRVALIERDMEWIRATLAKWGMIAPTDPSKP